MELLSGWKAKLRKIEGQEAGVLEYREGIAQIFMREGPFRNIIESYVDVGKSQFQLSAQKVMQNYLLENQLSMFVITSNALQNGYYLEMKTIIEQILILINQELD